MKVESFYIFLIVCVFAVTPIYSQSASNTGSVYGRVQDIEGRSLAGVHVELESNIVAPISTTNSANGNFRFVNLPPGSYSLSFFLQGYTPAKQENLIISTGVQLRISMTLEPASDKTGIISGTVIDKNGIVLEGVSITLESDVLPKILTTTAPDGTYRFEGLPAGKYVLIFVKKGYLELKREQIEVPAGSLVQVNAELVSKVTPEKPAAPVVERRFIGISWTYSRDYFQLIPNGNNIYSILEQTPSLDSETFMPFNPASLGPVEPGTFPTVYARGADHFSTGWNYEGLNITIPDGQDAAQPGLGFAGEFPAFFPLDDLEEIQIVTAGNDISIPTGGTTINIVSKQGGREWHGSGSFFFSDDKLQSTNTPQEVKNMTDTPPLTNRLDSLQQYGFSLGGPIIQDKFFIWGAFYNDWFDRFNIFDELEENKSTSYNLKANLNFGASQQFQFGYFRADHRYRIDFFDYIHQLQQKPQTILPGIWSTQYTWVMNANTMIQARYGYVGAGYTISDTGFEDGGFGMLNSQQDAHDVNVEVDRFTENFVAGDHDLRFGFEYKTFGFRDFNPFLNPYYSPFSYSDENEIPDGPLTQGSLSVSYPEVPRTSRISRASLYASDVYRKGRLALNLGLRFDRQTGKNNARTYPSPLDVFETPDFLGPGFEDLLPPVDYPENDPGTTFDNFSPRIGATYDLKGNGRTVVYGALSRYYQPYDRSLLQFPQFIVGFSADYQNRNNDQVITPDELLSGSPYSVKDALSKFIYDPDLSNRFMNEYVIGIETKLLDEWSVSAAVTHRSYEDFIIGIPVGFAHESFRLDSTTVLQTPFGDFVKPIFSLPDFTDIGTAILKNNRGYTQTYDSFELMLRKSMDQNFMLSGGLVFQRQRGHHYSADLPPFYLRQPATSSIGPPINYDVFENHGYAHFANPYPEWEFKLSGAYVFPWQISLGGFLRYQQGIPYVLFGFEPIVFWFVGPNAPPGFFLVEPIGERRLDSIFTLDLKVDKEFHLKDYGELNLILEIFNVTNANTVIARVGHLGNFDEDYEFEPDGNLNTVLEFLSPRVVRLGLRYSF